MEPDACPQVREPSGVIAPLFSKSNHLFYAHNPHRFERQVTKLFDGVLNRADIQSRRMRFPSRGKGDRREQAVRTDSAVSVPLFSFMADAQMFQCRLPFGNRFCLFPAAALSPVIYDL